MDPRLGEYLKAAASRPFVWGGPDCATFPADWILTLDPTAPDPMGALRGAYGDQSRAAVLIARAGGLQELWTLNCGAAGLTRRRGRAAPGDIGLCWFLGQAGPLLAGAVSLGRGRWAALTPTGLLIGPARPKAVWRI